MPGHDPTIPGVLGECTHGRRVNRTRYRQQGREQLCSQSGRRGEQQTGCDGVAKSLGVQQLEQGGNLGQSKQAVR